MRQIKWELDGQDSGPGIIIQHVKKEFLDIQKVDLQTGTGDGHKMTPQEITTYTQNNQPANDAAVLLEYWEGWEIPANKTVPHYGGQPAADHDDQFAIPPLFKNQQATKNTTIGHIKMTGTASWYPGNHSLATLGFAVVNNSPAGILPMRTTAPALAAQPTHTITRTYDIKWDSTKLTGLHKGEYGLTTVT